MTINIAKRNFKYRVAGVLTGVLAAASGSAGAAEPHYSPGGRGSLDVPVIYHPEATNLFVANFGMVPATSVTVLDAETTALFVENFGIVPTSGDLDRYDTAPPTLTTQEFLDAFGAAPS